MRAFTFFQRPLCLGRLRPLERSLRLGKRRPLQPHLCLIVLRRLQPHLHLLRKLHVLPATYPPTASVAPGRAYKAAFASVPWLRAAVRINGRPPSRFHPAETAAPAASVVPLVSAYRLLVAPIYWRCVAGHRARAGPDHRE